jgi:hypothetical protein
VQYLLPDNVRQEIEKSNYYRDWFCCLFDWWKMKLRFRKLKQRVGKMNSSFRKLKRRFVKTE